MNKQRVLVRLLLPSISPNRLTAKWMKCKERNKTEQTKHNEVDFFFFFYFPFSF